MINFLKTILYIPLYNILIFLIWLTPGNSLGLAIIILTVLIRALLLPASLKAAKAQARLQLLAPEMNRIRQEITDKQAQGQALMELYKKEGVSPFGSCLPLLIQLPIILVLYRVFRIGLDTSRFDLLYSFTPHPTIINSHFLGIDLSKPELWIMPILAGVTQFVLSKMTMPPAPVMDTKNAENTQADPTQMINKQMIYLFPVMTWFIARSLPAALSLYWVVTTIFGILQQAYVNNYIKKNPREREEALEDAREVEAEFVTAEKSKSKSATSVSKTSDMINNMMKKRLDKQEKKTGVEITIRKKH